MFKLFIQNKLTNFFVKNCFFFNTNHSTIFFLRKSRIFVKSRFSRNRQWAKNIVYFGLWTGIINVFWTTWFCYKYTFIFSSFFWVLYLVVLALSYKHFIKSRLYLYRSWLVINL